MNVRNARIEKNYEVEEELKAMMAQKRKAMPTKRICYSNTRLIFMKYFSIKSKRPKQKTTFTTTRRKKGKAIFSQEG